MRIQTCRKWCWLGLAMNGILLVHAPTPTASTDPEPPDLDWSKLPGFCSETIKCSNANYACVTLTTNRAQLTNLEMPIAQCVPSKNPGDACTSGSPGLCPTFATWPSSFRALNSVCVRSLKPRQLTTSQIVTMAANRKNNSLEKNDGSNGGSGDGVVQYQCVDFDSQHLLTSDAFDGAIKDEIVAAVKTNCISPESPGIVCSARGTCAPATTPIGAKDYRCQCNLGYGGNFCQKILSNKCSMASSCEIGQCDLTSRTCQCPQGATGNQCSQCVDQPGAVACSGHGKCFSNACLCDASWTGAQCQWAPWANNSSSGTGGSSKHDDTGKSGMKAGTILGIVFGCLATILVLVIVFAIQKRKTAPAHQKFSINVDSPTRHSSPANLYLEFGDDESQDAMALRRRPHNLATTFLCDDALLAARIDLNLISYEEKIGQGAQGEVYRGKCNNREVAIKRLLPEKRKEMACIEKLLAEVKLVADMEHPCIVEFVAVAWDTLSNLCVVYEYMSFGSLRSMLSQFHANNCRQGFSAMKVQIAMDIAHALTYLHSLSPKVVHRDLKSGNVLLNDQMRAKVTDFGVSRANSDYASMTVGIGTSLWMAPEVMTGTHYDERADIFSFGVVLCELDTHQLPFATSNLDKSGKRIPDVALMQLIARGEIHTEFSPFAPAEIRHLGECCMSLDPTERPTAAQVAFELHRFMKSQYDISESRNLFSSVGDEEPRPDPQQNDQLSPTKLQLSRIAGAFDPCTL